MRVERWIGKEVFNQIAEQALENGNAAMDEVVASAKARCPVGTITRSGGFQKARISFTPKTGRNKGKLVSFTTEKRWTGRRPGSLRDTIRRVTFGKSGNIRVYAGNFKVYWALYIERGTVKMGKQPFLRPTFHAKKLQMLDIIKNGK